MASTAYHLQSIMHLSVILKYGTKSINRLDSCCN